MSSCRKFLLQIRVYGFVNSLKEATRPSELQCLILLCSFLRISLHVQEVKLSYLTCRLTEISWRVVSFQGQACRAAMVQSPDSFSVCAYNLGISTESVLLLCACTFSKHGRSIVSA